MELEVMAIIIALGAFAISAWSAEQTRKHNEVCVTPHLIIDYYTRYGEAIKIQIDSQGPGAAEFIEYKWLINNKEFHIKSSDDYIAILKELNLDMMPFYCWTPKTGEYFNVGYKQDMVKLKEISDVEQFKEIINKLSVVTIEIEYKSLYGKSFIVKHPLKNG